MPTISIFYGIRISMYAGDHPEPHFHVRYQGKDAVYALDGSRVKGEMPQRVDRLVSAWAEIHAEDLEHDWEIAESGSNPLPISPLH